MRIDKKWGYYSPPFSLGRLHYGEMTMKNKEFGGMKVTDITTPRIKQYIQKRMDEVISNATINRELAARPPG